MKCKKIHILFLLIALLTGGSVFGQLPDSLKVHLLVKQKEFSVKVNGVNIGRTKDFNVKPGLNRVSVYTPFKGVYDTVMNFKGGIIEQRLAARIKEIPQYRIEKNKRDWQRARLVVGCAATLIAPFAIMKFIDARREYDAAYLPVLQSASDYETAKTVADLKVAEDKLKSADLRMASARKKYIEAAIFAPVGLAISIGGAYLALSAKIPKLENRAKIQFDAISLNGNQLYPALRLTAEL